MTTRHDPLRASIVIGCLALCLAAVIYLVFGYLRSDDFQSQTAIGAPITIRMTVTAQNTSEDMLLDQAVRVFSPRPASPYQFRIKSSATEAHRTSADPNGNSWLEFQVTIPPYGIQTVSIESEIEATTRPKPGVDAPTSRDREPEVGVESDAREIVEKALALKQSEATRTAEELYRFVRDHIDDSGYIRDDLGALRAFRERRGDCTEYASLFVALARAAGLSARRVGGFVVSSSTHVGARDYHNWAEVYLDNAWRIVDPSRGVFLESDKFHVVYRVIRGSVSGTADTSSQTFLAFDPRLRVTLQ